MKFQYGSSVLVLPQTVLQVVEEADALALRVLLLLGEDPSLADHPQKLARRLSASQGDVRGAVDFWKKAGVLTANDGTAPSPEKPSPTPPKTRVTERRARKTAEAVPVYSSTEIADLLEASEGMRVLVDEAQRILGRIFTPADLNVLVGMTDYLQMDEACILLLLAHCKRIGKTNMRSIEQYAIRLSDGGVRDAAALDDYIREVELLHTLEGQVRRMFGMKGRSLTEKERKLLKRWADFGYGEEIVRRAYELNVHANNDPTIPYTGAILERWYEAGLRTPEEIDAEIAAEAERRRGPGEGMGSLIPTIILRRHCKEAFKRMAPQRKGRLSDEMRKEGPENGIQ